MMLVSQHYIVEVASHLYLFLGVFIDEFVIWSVCMWESGVKNSCSLDYSFVTLRFISFVERYLSQLKSMFQFYRSPHAKIIILYSSLSL